MIREMGELRTSRAFSHFVKDNATRSALCATQKKCPGRKGPGQFWILQCNAYKLAPPGATAPRKFLQAQHVAATLGASASR
jgi:hypothetical protein